MFDWFQSSCNGTTEAFEAFHKLKTINEKQKRGVVCVYANALCGMSGEVCAPPAYHDAEQCAV